MCFKVTVILSSLWLSVTCSGQQHVDLDSVRIEILLSTQIVRDSNDLHCFVVYTNLTRKPISIYSYLDEGSMGNRFFNINVEFEKLENGSYSRYTVRFYRNSLKLYLLSIAKSLFPGKYRTRIHLRTKTIPDYTKYNDSTFETPPPFDNIEYTSSQWLYFEVKRFVTVESSGKVID